MSTNKSLIIWPLLAVLVMAVIAIFLLPESSFAPAEKKGEATPTSTEEEKVEEMVSGLTSGDSVVEIEKDLNSLGTEAINYESEIQKLEKDLAAF